MCRDTKSPPPNKTPRHTAASGGGPPCYATALAAIRLWRITPGVSFRIVCESVGSASGLTLFTRVGPHWAELFLGPPCGHVTRILQNLPQSTWKNSDQRPDSLINYHQIKSIQLNLNYNFLLITCKCLSRRVVLSDMTIWNEFPNSHCQYFFVIILNLHIQWVPVFNWGN